MISFYNPNFHEKIMKKYGRIIRKSYFPDLFFKENSKLSNPEKINISVHIKFNFYKALFWNFPLSSPKEIRYGNSGFLPKPKVFCIKPTKYVHRKRISLYSEAGKHVTENLIFRLMNFTLSSGNFIFPKQVLSELISFNLTPFKLINNKITADNIQPFNLTSREPVFLKFICQDYLSAYYISLNPMFLKIKHLENNSRFITSKIRSKIQILWNHKDFLLKENDLVFIRSILPVENENFVPKNGHVAESPPHFSPPALVVHDLLSKIRNKILRKIGDSILLCHKNLFGGDVLALKFGIRIINYGSFEDLLKFVSPSIGPELLKQKSRVRKIAVETVQSRQYPGLERSIKKIWDKQNIIEKWVKQEYRELIDETPDLLHLINDSQTLPDSRRMQNMSLYLSTQFLILNFLKKNAFSLFWKYSSDSKNNVIEWKIIQKQKANLFNFSNEEHGKAFPAGKNFAVKKAIIWKKIPVKFGENFFVFRKDTQGFHNLHIRRTSKLFNSIGSKLLISKNEIMTVRIVNHELTSRYYQCEKPTGCRLEKIFTGSQANANLKFQRDINKHRTGFFEKVIIPSIEKLTKSLQSILKLIFCCNLEPAISESTITLMFNFQNIFPFSIVTTPQLYRQEANIFNSRQKSTLHTKSAYTGIHQTTGTLNYSTTSTQNHSAFSTFIYEKEHPFKNYVNWTSNLNAGMINDFPINNYYFPINNYIRGKELHFSAILNYDHLDKRILPGKKTDFPFSSLSFSYQRMGICTALSKKNILEYYNYSSSGLNTHAVTKYFRISKGQKPFLEDRILSKRLFSGRSLDASVSLISEIVGTSPRQKAIPVYGLFRFFALNMSQNHVFAGPYKVLSVPEIESLNAGNLRDKNALVSVFNVKQKLNGQKASCWKTELIIPSPGGKKEYTNSDYSRQRSVKLREIKYSKQQINKRIDNSAESQLVPIISSDFNLLSGLAFTLRIKWEKIFSTAYKMEKKRESSKDVYGILLRFKALESFEWTDKTHICLGPGRTFFAFPMKEETGKSIEISPFWTKRKNDFSYNVFLSRTIREDLLLLKKNRESTRDSIGALSRIIGISGMKVEYLKNTGSSETNALSEQKSSFQIAKSQRRRKLNVLAFSANKGSKEKNISSHSTYFPQINFDLQYAGSYEGTVIGPVDGSDKGKAIIERGEELVLRKPVMYASKNTPENIEDNPEYTSKKTIHFLPERNSSYRVSPDVINTIIDKVYRRLEAKLLIDKERRGLR